MVVVTLQRVALLECELVHYLVALHSAKKCIEQSSVKVTAQFYLVRKAAPLGRGHVLKSVDERAHGKTLLSPGSPHSAFTKHNIILLDA